MQRLDVGGAFQLTAAGVQCALRASPALRHLAADGSTLQDDAFRLAAAPDASSSSSSSSGSGDAERPDVLACAGALQLSHAAPCCASPLRQLESLSLRGCMFLRGGLLADLAAACPALTALDLAGCGMALK